MVGRTLGKYRIVDHLGAGGMGVVYRAVDQTLDREVAIKLVPEHLVGNADAHRRFLQEARLLSRLNHPNIAALYEFERDGEAQFLVMELVHGESLRTRLEAGPLPVSEVCRLGTQLAAGLSSASACPGASSGPRRHRSRKPAAGARSLQPCCCSGC